jgi:arylamine N-acetyltransferase
MVYQNYLNIQISQEQADLLSELELSVGQQRDRIPGENLDLLGIKSQTESLINRLIQERRTQLEGKYG